MFHRPAVDCIYSRVSVLAGGCFSSVSLHAVGLHLAFYGNENPIQNFYWLPSYTFHLSSPCFLRWSLAQSNDCATVRVGDTWLCAREGRWRFPPPWVWPGTRALPLAHSLHCHTSSGFTPLPLLVRFRTFLLLLSDGDDAGHPPGVGDARGLGAPHCLPVSSLPLDSFFSQVSEGSLDGCGPPNL